MDDVNEKLNALLSDPGSMAQITFFSTLLSIVTIPLIAAFLL